MDTDSLGRERKVVLTALVVPGFFCWKCLRAGCTAPANTTEHKEDG